MRAAKKDPSDGINSFRHRSVLYLWRTNERSEHLQPPLFTPTEKEHTRLVKIMRSNAQKAKPVHWRFADNPRPGSIYRLPDDMSLQRGITYTFLPDGRSMRVPSMNRMMVRASAEGHQENENQDIMSALQQMLSGKRPTAGKARFNNMGRAHVPDRRVGAGGVRAAARRGPAARNEVVGDGLRGIPIEA
jgi:hypothetical protein